MRFVLALRRKAAVSVLAVAVATTGALVASAAPASADGTSTLGVTVQVGSELVGGVTIKICSDTVCSSVVAEGIDTLGIAGFSIFSGLDATTYTVKAIPPSSSYLLPQSTQVDLASQNQLQFHLELGAKITGTVTRANGGTAVENASVVATQNPGSAQIITSTDASGAYLLRVPSGTAATGWMVSVNPPSGSLLDATNTPTFAHYDAETTTTQSFALVGYGTVSGTVTDSVSHAPIPNATVNLAYFSCSLFPATTDANGHYSITAPPATYHQLCASAGTHYDGIDLGATTIVSDTTTTVDIAVDPHPGDVTGSVDVIGGGALSGATVVVGSASCVGTSTTTDATGAYEVVGLDPGSYTVCADKAGHVRGTTSVTVTSDDSTAASTISLQPFTMPGAPRTVAALPTGKTGEAKVSYVAPLANGFTPITRYTATCASPGRLSRSGFDAAAPFTAITVTGLTNGATYSCTVKATNAVGLGPASAPGAAVRAGAPTAPLSVAAAKGTKLGTLKVSWSGALVPAGAAVLRYQGSCTAPGGVTKSFFATATTRSTTLTGLTRSKPYLCSVKATNKFGTGAARTSSVAVTPR